MRFDCSYRQTDRFTGIWIRHLRLVRTLCVLFTIMLLAAPVAAQDDYLIGSIKGQSPNDADFQDQGEYVGTIPLAGQSCSIGLQVVALGDGNFDALLYRGGLPGNGYDGSDKQKLSGSRSGEQVVLRGETLIVYLQTGYAAVAKSLEGERLGFLQPIKRISPTLGAKPPDNATVLFDGKSNDRLKNARVTEDGLLEVGSETKDVYQNFTLHAEFRTPYMPLARSQDRGNSGFYLQKRYEVQVLDSFGIDPKFNDCGALYRLKAPDLNMCFPPLRWQTYDITFNAAKFRGDGFRYCKARITVRHNGVLIHNNAELTSKTGAGSPEAPNPMPILFQNHNNDVHFRNIWIVDDDACNVCEQCCFRRATSVNCRHTISCRH